ncbi:succinate-semialdehyde dehydrogenase/glutarate-semialdehyde dehydrogenase [Bradyrhizobium sp. USDA 4524]|nr:succinate-semialdehyde dehydrogenase/glutarate-semialdehyde dehydrogenase [Bradyrhizobium sp. USDA 4538]MCP1899180.1 succinate-semialdehyde dehydrogenase/glutarate-semialdehyde dehydrogenase [Bradyrhizobium sp. USDA 4537]MCP1986708.1 succinate-semialdehyde dehydrogenase/glutarate-semialdehyde dehydrogenase [Bradyrhizobium sp. USDA 4539]
MNYKLFIDGAWRPGGSGNDLAIINPATEQEFGRVAVASASDLDDTLRSAQKSLLRWSNTPANERGSLLVRAARILKQKIEAAAAALSREQGKTLAEATGEYVRAVEMLEWNGLHAEEVSAPFPIDEKRIIVPEAIGVVAGFAPWNYPAVLNARKLAAPIAAGCPVILKAAEETPSAGVYMIDALKEAGIPPGVVSLVFGNPPMISRHLLGSPVVRALSFTGSTPVGKQLAKIAASNLQRCILELGGHSPVVVFEDTDISKAVSAISEYKFECAGQSCNAPSRILVARSIYEEFLARLVRAAEKIRVGRPDDPETDMGPMANARRIEAMERLTKDAVDRGARVETGGKRINRPGFYWAPTILSNVHPDSQVLREEPFGPILTVAPFSTIDEAIEEANATEYGLASYFFTNSPEVQKRMIRSLSAGAVSINHLKGVSADAPNAGIKQSGYGYEGGVEGARVFQNLKLVNATKALAVRQGLSQ